MRKLSILFLKLSILFVTLPLMLLAGYGIFSLLQNPVNPVYAWMLYPVIAGVYLSLLPLFWILQHLYRLLEAVAGNKSWNEKEGILKKLRKGSLFFAGVFVFTEPFVFQVAQEDDAPGLIIFFLIPAFFALVFSAILTLFIDREKQEGSLSPER